MLVRQSIAERLSSPLDRDEDAPRVSLATRLRGDPSSARVGLLHRLGASRIFARGDRTGVLRFATRRPGKGFRLDLRQRVIVKALVSRHVGRSRARSTVLAGHISYLGRSGAGADGGKAVFFDRASDSVDAKAVVGRWAEDRHHFRFIISPEHGDRIADLRVYVREVMSRVAADLGEPGLQWLATCHFDTDQPHAHVLVRGRRDAGADLVIPRVYMGYGFRGRAQEVAQELLGDLSRPDAERRVWREVEADRFTGFDRRLLQSADADRTVDDAAGRGGAWSALSRGRLRHLEKLGLATREGDRYRLAEDLELKLRGLQLRGDIIRTLHQRRLEGREVRELDVERIRGRVVKSGAHDELGSVRYVIIRDASGVEHYARLAFATPPLGSGRMAELIRTARGAYGMQSGRSVERGGR